MSAVPALLAMEKAKVHDWPNYIGWSVGLLIVIAVVYWLMRQGWNWRRTLQSDLAALPAVPAETGTAILESSGRYHGSTIAGSWLERVVAHGLGARSLADLTLTERGLLVRRPGQADLWLAAGDLTGARTDSGIAGKVVPAGLLVVGWRLAGPGGETGTELESGFRLDHPDDHAAWVTAIAQLATQPAPAGTTKTEGVTP
ncbi:hypothetical protein OG500_07835 [Kitasatospora sp. NBC_01250]|uniref:PH-like domain-containing protein n=1 Tax=unclassified Kitasatospora TaxID=2633591 RepID=UPI002E138F45|nr:MULTISPECIES: hypothetical protein [unclassified Kitasatospora]WSJ66015.1 hypothetical protein OG294_07755 [Kitasatospora sp. NBC_01302]